MRASALATLRSAGPDLTPALRKIAHYALNNPEQVMVQTVSELAEGSGASEASVIRFCRDLGFAGFQDFKLSLAFELAVSPLNLAPTQQPKTAREALEYLSHHAKTTLEDTVKLISPAALERVLSWLLEVKQVEFFGVGASGVTAQDFAYKFVRLGFQARAHTDPHLAAMVASTLDRGVVAFGISHSGTTLDTVKALERAGQAGARTVALTRRAKSPLAQLADQVLITSVSENPLSGGSISAKMGQLLVLDVLYTLLALRGERSSHFIAQTAAAVADRNV